MPFAPRFISLLSADAFNFILISSPRTSKAGPEAAAPAAPPPPPSRAQTASPSRSMRPPPSSGPTPPLPRIPSSLNQDNSTNPHQRVVSAPPPKFSSSSGPPSGEQTPPPGVGSVVSSQAQGRKTLDPMEALFGSGGGALPPSRGPTPTGSQAARKKNVRARYVRSPSPFLPTVEILFADPSRSCAFLQVDVMGQP